MTTDDHTADTGRQAAEQARDNASIFAPHTLTFDDGTSIEVPPNPTLRLLDDERLAEYDRLMFEAESYDREPEIYIPEQVIKDKAGNELRLPAETRPGALRTPYRRTVDGETSLVTPPHEVRVVKAVLGEQQYDMLRNGLIDGRRGSSADVWRVWNIQGMDLVERQRNDSKSDGGVDVLAAVSEADSQ